MSKSISSRAAAGTLVIVAAAIAGPGEAVAQEAPEAPQRSCVCAFGAEPGDLRVFRAGRARIGVRLGDAATVEGRTGVRVGHVEDAGPASRAGLREGDIIMALNGSALGDEPAARLVELLGEVEPGDEVTVEYRRGQTTGSVGIVTDRASVFTYRSGMDRSRAPFAGMRMAPLDAVRELRPAMFERLAFRDGPTLVEMNAGLGEYFGVSEGVLVAEAGAGAGSMGLLAGDVILSIGGRAVHDAAHARSIIASFRPDEDIVFQVQRRNRRMEVTGRRSP